MARATSRRDGRGNLYVYVSGMIDGERVEVRRRVPGDDEDLGQRVVDEHNRRFLVADFSILRDALAARRERRRTGLARTPARGRRRHGLTLAEWRERWLDSIDGTLAPMTCRVYRSASASLISILGGDRPLSDLMPGDLVTARAELTRRGLAIPTITTKLSILRRCLEDAVLFGILESNPFTVRISPRRTKRARRAAWAPSSATLPLSAEELSRLLAVVRAPDSGRPYESAGFPLTEALILTGLRFGEAAALVWPVVDWKRGRVEILRTRDTLGSPKPGEDNPTKTGAEWSIPLRAPLRALLQRQRERVYLQNPAGWVFPSMRGVCQSYADWYHRIWPVVVRRAGVVIDGRGGNAQKLLRKAYLTNSLVLGRNPKRVASEVGHRSIQMLTSHYEQWFDESLWPEPAALARLLAVYGFEDVVGQAARGAPPGGGAP